MAASQAENQQRDKPQASYGYLNQNNEKREELYVKLLADYKYNTLKHYDEEKEREVIQYQCGYEGCRKVLQKPWNLLDHVRMHEGVKPYECEWCGKKFTQKGNLKKHSRQHENPDVNNRKRYNCRYCNKGYTERYNLKVGFLLNFYWLYLNKQYTYLHIPIRNIYPRIIKSLS